MNKFAIPLCYRAGATLQVAWHLLLLTDITIRDSEAIGLSYLALIDSIPPFARASDLEHVPPGLWCR
jgi:hypothetical protein